MCAFNASHLRQLRNQKNSAAKMKRPSTYKNLPFVTVSELLDGDYPLRLWPGDPVKNPFGYLFYKTHRLLNWEGKPIGSLSAESPAHQCPRSSNWDPIPMHWEDDMGVVYEDPSEEERAKLTPVFKERCACCETEAQVVDLGIDVEKLPEHLQDFLVGISGNEAWHFPCTIGAVVAGVTKEMGQDGKMRDVTDYKMDKEARFHCDLSLSESRIKDKLLKLIEETPDCSHMIMGRWFRLSKANGGKGVGGYELDIRPNPSPAGFDLPKTYPNYSSWGKGSPAYGRPSKRFKYSEIEAIISDRRAPWVEGMEALGVTLSDAF